MVATFSVLGASSLTCCMQNVISLLGVRSEAQSVLTPLLVNGCPSTMSSMNLFKSLTSNDSDNSHRLANETYNLTFQRGKLDPYGYREFVWQETQTQAEFVIIGEVDAILGREIKVFHLEAHGKHAIQSSNSITPDDAHLHNSARTAKSVNSHVCYLAKPTCYTARDYYM